MNNIFTIQRSAHWECIARDRTKKTVRTGNSYHCRISAVYSQIIPEGLRVLELGCGEGSLLAALKPLYGVGVDFVPEMIEAARRRHPEYRFEVGDVHEIDLAEQFDAIVLSDLVNDVWDVQQLFANIARHSHPGTRVVINAYSHLWEQPLKLTQALGLSTPLLQQNWLTLEDISDLLYLEDMEIIKHFQEIVLPLPLGLISKFCNTFLVRFTPFRQLALTNFIVARPMARVRQTNLPTVSVIIPARNEAGNIRGLLERTPDMGSSTEIIFVEGNSSDNTWDTIERLLPEFKHRDCKLFKQSGKGKGDAVRVGFAQAKGDILMILDADMTVPPEDLPRFYEAIRSGKGEFINGVRLVYPMEDKAMRFLNLLGNKFFSLAFSWLLGQPIKDTLCGTKVMWRKDYERVAANRSYFGEFDPFGDFDLIFGAAKLNLKIVDVPIRYRERVYGDTNIQRFRHGLILLKMVIFAAKKIKFI
ncbi:MAG: bifunctional class I SAM-dependent methyltransferase/glycosyltransferase family 2 protein [Desulfuromonadales bacterium]